MKLTTDVSVRSVSEVLGQQGCHKKIIRRESEKSTKRLMIIATTRFKQALEPSVFGLDLPRTAFSTASFSVRTENRYPPTHGRGSRHPNSLDESVPLVNGAGTERRT
jgi:hypothetical protein